MVFREVIIVGFQLLQTPNQLHAEELSRAGQIALTIQLQLLINREKADVKGIHVPVTDKVPPAGNRDDQILQLFQKKIFRNPYRQIIGIPIRDVGNHGIPYLIRQKEALIGHPAPETSPPSRQAVPSAGLPEHAE